MTTPRPLFWLNQDFATGPRGEGQAEDNSQRSPSVLPAAPDARPPLR